MKTKHLFAESVLLQRPDYKLPFIIYTDASFKCLGSVLTQQEEDGQFRVIATASRGLAQQEL